MSDELDKIMAKMKRDGITITTRSAPGASFEEPRVTSVIAERAKKHGIYYDKGEK